jgi:hypothetical protein
MLRLNPPTLSRALGQQLLESAAHLRPTFESALLPLVAQRLLDRTLQRANSGSIGLGSVLTLFLAAHQRAPRLIAEVGTYIGNSAAAMGLGAGTAGQALQLVTCDLHPCTQMFQALAAKQAKLDMLHLDGRLMADDLKLVAQLLKDDTLVALDDCEGDEKGHMNLDLLRRAGLLQQHAFVEPFPRDLFRAWNLETRSVTGLLVPLKLINYTRQ